MINRKLIVLIVALIFMAGCGKRETKCIDGFLYDRFEGQEYWTSNIYNYGCVNESLREELGG